MVKLFMYLICVGTSKYQWGYSTICEEYTKFHLHFIFKIFLVVNISHYYKAS